MFITSTIIWPQGGNTALPKNRNWMKDLLSMAPPIRTRPSFPFSQSLASEASMLLHQRAKRVKTTITEN